MIGKVLRGGHVGGLLRYLFGPGRANEHVDPHLVASWDDDPWTLEPVQISESRRDVRPLTSLLQQPLAASTRLPGKPVWHCALRVAPGDRRLTDAEWAEVARDVVHLTGYAPRGDDGGCRWVAVRHADDHIHLVVTLARQDGARVSTSNDFYRVGEACRAAERRLRLTTTAPRDRTAARRPTRAESEKATRSRRPEAARTRLRREVRTAVAGATGSDDFLSRLQSAGLMVRPRFSERNPDEITGYAVALPGDHNPQGAPVWFGGGKLAADLAWGKVTRRWRTNGPNPGPASTTQPRGSRLSGAERDAAWARAARAAAAGAADVRRLATIDPNAAADAAHATGDALASTAYVVEGRRGGPVSDAAAAYDRAARELWGRMPRPTPAGDGLRAAARLLMFTGRASRDESAQYLHLLAQLIALTDAVARLRQAQGRSAQASAAHQAAERLRAVAPDHRRKAAGPRLRRGTPVLRPDPIPATARSL